MNSLDIVRDDNQADIDRILYERPISRLYSRRIGLLAGRHARLKVISDVYQIITSLNHDAVLVAEEALKEHTLPANVFLHPSKKISEGFTNTDEAFEVLSDCTYLIVGMDLEIGAHFQLFLEKLITSRSAPIVFTNESIDIGKISPQLFEGRTDDVYVCNTQHLLSLARYLEIEYELKSGAGILNKLEVLKILSCHLNSTVVCVEDYQILAVNYNSATKAVVTNLKNTKNIRIDLMFAAILTSLLCDNASSQDDILKRIITASYILRAILSSELELEKTLKNILTQ